MDSHPSWCQNQCNLVNIKETRLVLEVCRKLFVNDLSGGVVLKCWACSVFDALAFECSQAMLWILSSSCCILKVEVGARYLVGQYR